jgi:hypothetical protein
MLAAVGLWCGFGHERNSSNFSLQKWRKLEKLDGGGDWGERTNKIENQPKIIQQIEDLM